MQMPISGEGSRAGPAPNEHVLMPVGHSWSDAQRYWLPFAPHALLHSADRSPLTGWLRQHTPGAQVAALVQARIVPWHCPYSWHVRATPTVLQHSCVVGSQRALPHAMEPPASAEAQLP